MKNPPLRRGIFVCKRKGKDCKPIEGRPLYDLDKLCHCFPLCMARGGDTFLGRISDGEDGDKIVVCHLRKELFYLGRVKVTDPCRAQSLVVNGEHDVGRDDGGIHIGEIASVVLTYPYASSAFPPTMRKTPAPKV